MLLNEGDRPVVFPITLGDDKVLTASSPQLHLTAVIESITNRSNTLPVEHLKFLNFFIFHLSL